MGTEERPCEGTETATCKPGEGPGIDPSSLACELETQKCLPAAQPPSLWCGYHSPVNSRKAPAQPPASHTRHEPAKVGPSLGPGSRGCLPFLLFLFPLSLGPGGVNELSNVACGCSDV